MTENPSENMHSSSGAADSVRHQSVERITAKDHAEHFDVRELLSRS